MDMVDHQDIGIEAIRVSLLISYKYFEVFGVVVGVFEYLQSLIAPSYDVIECTFEFYPRFLRHGITLSSHIANVNKQV